MPPNPTNQLTHNQKYSNPDGTFTPEFIRQWNRQKAINGDFSDVVVAGGGGLTGGGKLSDAPLTISMPDQAGVTPATYGDGTHVAQIAVDKKGRITGVSNIAITAGGGLPINPPTTTLFSTAINSANLTLTVADDPNMGYTVHGVSTAGANDRFAFRGLAVPGTPYTRTARYRFAPGTSFHRVGIGWTDGTKILFGLSDGLGTPPGTIAAGGVVKATNFTTFGSTPTAAVAGWGNISEFWLRVSDDGVNLKVEASPDGVIWVTMFTEGRTVFMAGGPTHVGAVIWTFGNTSGAVALQIPYWQ